MLHTLKQWFALEEPTNSPKHELDLVCAVLLLEIALADCKWQQEEQQRICNILQHTFNLTEQQATALIQQAKTQQQTATDLYQFTKEINQHYDYPQRCQFLYKLWQVAYADAVIDPIEEHRIRKIANLLFVDHADFIREKHRAQNSV